MIKHIWPSNPCRQARRGCRPQRCPAALVVWLSLACGPLFLAQPSWCRGQEPPPPVAAAPVVAPAPQGSAWLGLVGDDYGKSAGVKILEVRADGPAIKAGLAVGDLITGMAGLEVDTLDDLALLLRQLEPGQSVKVELVRDGRRRQAMVQVVARPEPIQASPSPSPIPDAPELPPPPPPRETPATPVSPVLGIRVTPYAEGLGDEGVRIERVSAYTPAHEAGLRPGQIITECNEQPIRSPEDLARMLQGMQVGQQLRLKVFADGQPRAVSLVLTGEAASPPNDPPGQSTAAPSEGEIASATRALIRQVEDLRAQVQLLQQRIEALEKKQN